jgi:centromeric protein E
VPEEPDVPPEPVVAETAKDCSIAAVVRLKPHPPTGMPVWTLQGGAADTVVDGQTGQDYKFDQVFGPESTTEELFQSCAGDLVRSFCHGENATIMAYGQTASGKTHTMEGAFGEDGIMQLSVQEICAFFADPEREGTSYNMRVAYLEIHNEKLRDLLAEGGPNEVKLLESATGHVQTNPALSYFDVSKPDDMLRCLDAGRAHRHVGQTRANDHSSRSHTVLQLQLESKKANESFMRRSLLNLVDLAGSESAKHTGAVGERLLEGKNINRSLLALSQVVQAMADTSRSAPRPSFRDSKLTRVLQQSIGGNSRTALICTVSTVDWNYHENKRTLEFALRAKCIKNQVSANLVKIANRSRTAKSGQECRKLQTQNEQLQLQLAQLRAQLASGGQENLLPKVEMRPPSPMQRAPLVLEQKRPLAPSIQEFLREVPCPSKTRPQSPLQKRPPSPTQTRLPSPSQTRQPSPSQTRQPSPSQRRQEPKRQVLGDVSNVQRSESQDKFAEKREPRRQGLTDVTNVQDSITERREPRRKNGNMMNLGY